MRLRMATRGSRLALAQSKIVAEFLQTCYPGVEVEVVTVRTLGDVLPPEKLGQIDGKSAFTSEIEKRLLEGKADFAVHSMKDLPADIDERLVIASTPRRAEPRDALVSASGRRLADLKAKPKIGTSSARRKAQLLRLRPDAEIVEIHGNVETRLKRMSELELDGIVLAAAGLQRLGLGDKASQIFDVAELVPAACQGTIAVEARKDDASTLELLQMIDDPDTRAESRCERAFSKRLGGDCYVPLGAFAKVKGRSMDAVGMVASEDGSKWASSQISGPSSGPESLGEKLADEVADSGGKVILEGITR